MKSSRTVLMTACLAGAVCLASAALAQAPATPAAPIKGEAVMGSVSVSATVTSIDQATRAVTLLGNDGQVYSFIAGDAVKNLAQVKKGDVVTATYTEAVAYEVRKGGTASAETTAAAGSAKLGLKPAGVVAQQTTVTVMITAIDTKAPSVTFKGPAGNTRTIKVLDPTKLQGVKVGDSVDLTYTEALAIKVDPAPKK